MCAWGSSFQYFMGKIGGSTRANRPNRLLGATCGIIGKKTMGGRLLVHGRLIGIIHTLKPTP